MYVDAFRPSSHISYLLHLSQGGDADETAQGGGGAALDDEDTLNLDDAGFSRTDLPPGGGVGADVDQAEEEEEEEVGHLLFCSAVLCPCCCDARGRLAGLLIGLSWRFTRAYCSVYSVYPETRVSYSRVAFSSPHLICLYPVRAFTFPPVFKTSTLTFCC